MGIKIAEKMTAKSTTAIFLPCFLLLNLRFDELSEVGNFYALLGAGVAIAEGDGIFVFGLFAEGVEIDGDAERRADLVLAAVALADVAVVVEHDAGNIFFQQSKYF